MESFISELKKDPVKKREEIFTESFQLSRDEVDSLLFFGMINLNTEIDVLEKQLHKMRQLKFETFIQSELEGLQEKYPSGKPIILELFTLDGNDEFVLDKLGGVSAYTEYNDEMCFIVYPEEKIRSTLKSVIAHEFHHHWRIAQLEINEENETLLDRLVLEGLAEHFVRIEYSDEYLGPFKDALTEKEAKSLWDTKFKTHFFDKGSLTEPFMIGNKEQGLPFWGGYSLGYYLVKWFIEKHRDLSIEELTLLPSEKYR